MSIVEIFGSFWKVSYVIKITAEYFGKFTFYTSKQLTGEVSKFITFQFRVSSGRCVPKIIKMPLIFQSYSKSKSGIFETPNVCQTLICCRFMVVIVKLGLSLSLFLWIWCISTYLQSDYHHQRTNKTLRFS